LNHHAFNVAIQGDESIFLDTVEYPIDGVSVTVSVT
jgi:hypothetical protein